MTKTKMRGRAQQGVIGSPAVAPYGSWKSPITSNLITRQSIKLSEVWLDGKPAAGKRPVCHRACAEQPDQFGAL